MFPIRSQAVSYTHLDVYKRQLLMCIGVTSFAQTIWTGAGGNSNWNTTGNWSTNLIPTATDDVIIPTGSSVIINVSSSVKSIVVQGTSSVTINQNLSFKNASSFSANTTVSWNANSLYGCLLYTSRCV